MKKKMFIITLSLMLIIGGATVAMAATDSDNPLDGIKALYQQLFNTQKAIVDEQVKAGVLTQEQADLIKQQMELREQYREQALENGQLYGPGFGCGYGPGAGRGFGCGNWGGSAGSNFVPGQGPASTFQPGMGPGYGRRGGFGAGASVVPQI